LALLAVLFLVSLLIAGTAGYAIWLGAEMTGAQMKGAAIVLALPAGVGYLAARAIRRRHRVLRG
jgi:hypothetical protein